MSDSQATSHARRDGTAASVRADPPQGVGVNHQNVPERSDEPGGPVGDGSAVEERILRGGGAAVVCVTIDLVGWQHTQCCIELRPSSSRQRSQTTFFPDALGGMRVPVAFVVAFESPHPGSRTIDVNIVAPQRIYHPRESPLAHTPLFALALSI